jgi:glycopeptide antibiotics resistance protein
MTHKTNKTHGLSLFLFFVYVATLIWIIVFKLNIDFSYMGQKRSMNLIPFDKPLIINGKADLGEIIMNILIFVPLGIYFDILFKKWHFLKKLIVVALTSLILESSQYILAIGAFDITDIITNTTGGIIGIAVFKCMVLLLGNGPKAQKVFNFFALIITILIVGGLLYLKTNKLLMFRR